MQPHVYSVGLPAPVISSPQDTYTDHQGNLYRLMEISPKKRRFRLSINGHRPLTTMFVAKISNNIVTDIFETAECFEDSRVIKWEKIDNRFLLTLIKV
jgi:hypothetical protein